MVAEEMMHRSRFAWTLKEKRRYVWLLAILLIAAVGVLLLVELPKKGASVPAPRLVFWGAARRVGGSCLIVENAGERFIIDCGALGETEGGAIPPHPDSLSFAILTHAHVDHCGLLAELVKAGFRGRIYCTEPTGRLAPIMLAMERGISREKMPREIFDRALAALTPVPYGRTFGEKHMKFRLRRAEHLLGAASVEMWLPSGRDTVKLVVSGDLGGGNAVLIPPRDTLESADYVVIESTYGGVVRGSRGDTLETYGAFAGAIGAALRRGGDVLVAAFTLGRTQEILAVIDRFQRIGVIPADADVFVDSPTAQKITDVYRAERGELSDWARSFYPVDVLRFPTLREVRSKTSLKVHSCHHRPTIFVSSSGDLSNASAPRHLMRMFASNRNLLCITGWQSPGSLGARLLAGQSPVAVRHQEGRRFKEDWLTPALEIRGFRSFSGHADQAGLLAWLRPIRGVRRVFIVHGEEDQAVALGRAIGERLGLEVEIPHRGESFEIPVVKRGAA
jgi:metallo-beta-lactamase family protein